MPNSPRSVRERSVTGGGPSVGTPFFMAPEQMTGKAVGRKCDVWAVGGLALLCATGDPPWKTKNFKTPYALMIAVCRSSDGPPVDGYDLSPELLDFIGRCFTRDAERRPSADDILRHAFLASLGDSASAPSPAAAAPAPAPLPPPPGKEPDFLQRLKARLSSP